MMKLPTFPAKLYFAVFLTVALIGYSYFNLQLYLDAEDFRTKTQQKTQTLAKQELEKWIQLSLESDQKMIQSILQWDEIYQQFSDPSYYFFWHEVRLKESEYWRPYFDALELYDQNRNRLLPPLKQSPTNNTQNKNILPQTLADASYPLNYFEITNQHLDFVTILPIPDRKDPSKTIGHMALTLDFLPKLYQYGQFTYVDKTSLQVQNLQKITQIQPKDLIQYLTFEEIKNPVDDYLWDLIQDFINKIISVGFLIALLFFVFFKISTLQPLKQLSAYLSQLKSRPDQLTPPPQSDFMFLEFEGLKNTLFSYHQQLFNAKSEIEKQNQIASEQARLDALSGVYNRRAFDEALDELLKTYQEQPRNVTFMLFDCDFFKAINDTYGHEIGDEVIRISAKTFKKSLPMAYHIYRIGGDEFATIIEDKTLEEVQEIALRCHQNISQYPFEQLGIHERISYSIGLSFIAPENRQEIPLLHRQADIALYAAKRSIHHKVQTYHSEMKMMSETLVSSELVNTILKSIQTGEGIQMHGQSVFNAKQQKCYAEALIRIHSPQKPIYPYEIFQVIEHRGLEVELDKQILQQLLDLLASTEIQDFPGLSINLSAHTLLREDLNQLFAPFVPYLKDYKIVLEVLEGTLIDNLELVSEKLNDLRQQGFKVALDDFGSGYSSIRYLAHMPVDIIKFDLSLTHGLLEDEKTAKIIRNTAQMIRDADYELVMEGIETEAHLQAALEAGATHLQGYYFEKPTPFKPTYN